ncbi:MAG: hypothetical protein JEZ02_00020 [Desulfatibacillum sp.]|nr:hypothetical protein [Desulfatibacillum sp.]
MQLVPWRTLGEATDRGSELEELWNRSPSLTKPLQTKSPLRIPYIEALEIPEDLAVTADLTGAEPQ